MRSPASLDNLEAALERAVSRFDDGSATGAQMRHHMESGVSDDAVDRVRARLAIAAALEAGGAAGDALDAACAVEIVYQFSLIHEDIEATETFRGARATVWSQYGLAHGINAGDALCAVGYLALLDGVTQRSPQATVAMTRILHEAQLAMCGGHGRAIAYDREPTLTPRAYNAVIDGKTAAMYGAACELGALAAGAPVADARAYARLGAGYGRALHIADDVRRSWRESATPPVGKWTYPAVWALAGPPSAARDCVAAAFADPAGRSTSAAALAEAFDTLGAPAAAERAIDAEAGSADAAAETAGIDRGARVRTLLRQALRRAAS